jgi:hypothetical protein
MGKDGRQHALNLDFTDRRNGSPSCDLDLGIVCARADTFALCAANPRVIGSSFGAIAGTHILDAIRGNVVGLLQMPPRLFVRRCLRPFAGAMEREQRVKSAAPLFPRIR